MPHVDEGLLHAYLDGELSPVERTRVDEHLTGCLACRTRLDEERQLIERASKLLGFAAPVERPAPPLHQLERPKVWWHVRMPLAWAATVILAIGLGWQLSEQLGRPEVKTMSGPIAVRESQAPPAQQPATPAPATSGRLDVRRQRGFQEHPEPTLAQKSTAQPDSVLADRLTSVTAAEERAGAGAAAPTPAPAAANLPSPNLAPRMQAVERDEALVSLDSAAVRAILGREPLVIPGLAVRSITRSGRAPNEIVVAQALDSTHVILLFEARQTMTRAYVERDLGTSGADARAPTAAAKAAPPDTLAGRLIGDILVEVTGPVARDSLAKLLRRVH